MSASLAFRDKIRRINEPSDVFGVLGSDLEQARDTALRGVLNAAAAKNDILASANRMRTAVKPHGWEELRKAKDAERNDLIGKFTAAVIAHNPELWRLDRVALTEFVAHSFWFKGIAATALLDVDSVLTGLEKNARADKLLNTQLDQYMVVYGACAHELITLDEKAKARYARIHDVVGAAVRWVNQEWDWIWDKLQENKGRYSILDERDRVHALEDSPVPVSSFHTAVLPPVVG